MTRPKYGSTRIGPLGPFGPSCEEINPRENDTGGVHSKEPTWERRTKTEREGEAVQGGGAAGDDGMEATGGGDAAAEGRRGEGGGGAARWAVGAVCGGLVYYHCAVRRASAVSLAADVLLVLLCSLSILGLLFRHLHISSVNPPSLPPSIKRLFLAVSWWCRFRCSWFDDTARVLVLSLVG